jgi:hypothetical protein
VSILKEDVISGVICFVCILDSISGLLDSNLIFKKQEDNRLIILSTSPSFLLGIIRLILKDSEYMAVSLEYLKLQDSVVSQKERVRISD